MATHHVQFALAVDDGGADERGKDAPREGVVGVDDGAVLGIAGGQARIETGPEKPEEERTWR